MSSNTPKLVTNEAKPAIIQMVEINARGKVDDDNDIDIRRETFKLSEFFSAYS